MCCGRGVKAAASKHSASPTSKLENSMVEDKEPEKLVFGREQVDMPDHPLVVNQGAYYGNPVKKAKTKKAVAVKPVEHVEHAEKKVTKKKSLFSRS